MLLTIFGESVEVMAVKNNLELIDYLNNKINACSMEISLAIGDKCLERQIDYRIRRSVYYEILQLVKGE